MQIQNETLAVTRRVAAVGNLGRPQVYAIRRCGSCTRALANGELKVVISRREAGTYLGRRAMPRLNLLCASCFRDFRQKKKKAATGGYIRNRRGQSIYMWNE